MEENIGKMARLGDVWYQIMDSREVNGQTQYKLYTRDEWVPANWIKEIKGREKPKQKTIEKTLLYESEDWVVTVNSNGIMHVSYFEDGHYKDEVCIYIGDNKEVKVLNE